jgi:hypothetical protein
MSQAVPELADQIDHREYSAEVSSRLAMQLVAVENILATSRAQGASVELMAPMHALTQRRVSDGFGGDNVSGLIELLVRPGDT